MRKFTTKFLTDACAVLGLAFGRNQPAHIQHVAIVQVLQDYEKQPDQRDKDLKQLRELRDAAIVWRSMDREYDRESPPRAVTEFCELIDKISGKGAD